MNALIELSAAGLAVTLRDGDSLIVSPACKLTDGLRAQIRRNKREIISILKTGSLMAPIHEFVDADLILSWLERIGETDKELITEIIERCNRDPDAMAYFVKRSKE